MNILVTGAGGFLGGQVVRRLMAEHDIFGLVRKEGALPAHPRVHPVVQDLTAPLDRNRLPGSLDAILHLAQSRNFRRFPDQAQDIFQVNTESTQRLLDYGRQARIKTFVLASSGGVCGYKTTPILETDPPEIMNFYLASKYAAECLVQAYGDVFVPVTLRYFFIYGEGQRDMFMPSLIGRVMKGEPVTVAGQRGMGMNPIHVDDAVEATVRALEVPRPEIINVAGAEPTTILDLAELIGATVGRKPAYKFEAEKGPMAMIASIEKMKLKLGVVPKVSLTEGVRRLADDLRRTG